MEPSDRAGHLVMFVYVVAWLDNRGPRYDRRRAGPDLGRSVIRIA